MKLYKYIADSDKFNNFHVDKEFWDLKNSIGEGNSIIDFWQPIPVKNFFLDKEGDFPETKGDFPSFRTGVPVLSERAWKIFEPYIANVVESLPLAYPNGNYFALNVLDVVSALNKDQSEISYRSSGKISRVFNYVFHKEKIENKLIFKIPETIWLETYISEGFRRLVEENNLKGLDFSQIIFEDDVEE